MSARYSVGIDVASRTHRVAVLGPGGEAVGKSFTIEATAADFDDCPDLAAIPDHLCVARRGFRSSPPQSFPPERA